MPRGYPPSSGVSFGSGRLSTAIKWLIYVNTGMFVATTLAPAVGLGDLLLDLFGLRPVFVLKGFWLWQPVTYMFLHGGLFHILFNMLALWMFGSELERTWGTRFFLKYYFITGVGTAATTILVSLLPFSFAHQIYVSTTIGASGAVYGLLLAYGLYFPDRPIYMYLVFPIPARYFVLIMGAISFLSSVSDAGGGIAHATHLGGLAVGYVYLKGLRLRMSPWAEVKYRTTKWRINRARRKFGVYSGGRDDDWDKRVH